MARPPKLSPGAVAKSLPPTLQEDRALGWRSAATRSVSQHPRSSFPLRAPVRKTRSREPFVRTTPTGGFDQSGRQGREGRPWFGPGKAAGIPAGASAGRERSSSSPCRFRERLGKARPPAHPPPWGCLFRDRSIIYNQAKPFALRDRPRLDFTRTGPFRSACSGLHPP